MPIRFFIVCLFLVNAMAIGVLSFTDITVLRIVAWLWLSASLTMAGLVEFGGWLIK